MMEADHNKIRLLLVDDHTLVRDGIRSLLAHETSFEFTGEAANGLQAIHFLEENEVDVILMDINMPVMNGIEATREITKKFPGVKVLTLSMNKDKGYISKMLNAGAMGYVLKDTEHEELVESIKQVFAGQPFFGTETSRIMMESFMPNTRVQHHGNDVDPEELTPREKEVLALIAAEMTNPEIAEKLFISVRTVDTHRRNLLIKLGAKNSIGLVKYAIKHNLDTHQSASV